MTAVPHPSVSPSGSSSSPDLVDDFGAVVRQGARGGLVVQPRMGMADPQRMRAGLAATRAADATTVGTLTLDSYTRVGRWESARRAVEEGTSLNGFPLVTHGPTTTRQVLAGVCGPQFPVQVRHGSAAPGPIVEAMLASGLHATEGGPVSYCLPYGRVPLAQSVQSWRSAVEHLASARRPGVEPHLETFGGCLMGQLCPPALLVAVSVLEGMFFAQHGVRSISLSYAQQTHPGQDEEAIAALRRLATELLPDCQVHVVLYAYMGVFPQTTAGASGLLADAARLAARTGTERLIVKTVAEAHRIPTVAENIAALEAASESAATVRQVDPTTPVPSSHDDTPVLMQARALVEAVVGLHDDLSRALLQAFAQGYLDVPFCLHPDNAGRSRSSLDSAGRLKWTAVGRMPITIPRSRTTHGPTPRLSSGGLLDALGHVRGRYDRAPDRPNRHRPSPGIPDPTARPAITTGAPNDDHRHPARHRRCH